MWQQKEAVHYIPEQKRMRFENVETSCPNTPPAEPEATAMMEKFLSCSPAVSSVLGAFRLRQWLQFRHISPAWKEAIDAQITALRLKRVTVLLSKSAVKCVDVLQFLARTTPNLHCISFDQTSAEDSSLTTDESLVISNFDQLKAINLTGLKSISAVVGVLETLDAKKLEQLSFPFLFSARDKSSEHADVLRLKPFFQSLVALKFLKMGNNGKLHPLLLELPAPESLKELNVTVSTVSCQNFILRCRSLEELSLCSLPGDTVERSVMEALAQMESLRSVAVNFSGSSRALQTIAKLPKLRSLKVNKGYSLPGIRSKTLAIPWTQLQSLTHLSIKMAGIANDINQLTSLISLDLHLSTVFAGTGFTCKLRKLQSLSVKVDHGPTGGCGIVEPPFMLLDLKSLSLRSHLIERIVGVDDFVLLAPNIQELAIDFLFITRRKRVAGNKEEEDDEDEEERQQNDEENDQGIKKEEQEKEEKERGKAEEEGLEEENQDDEDEEVAEQNQEDEGEEQEEAEEEEEEDLEEEARETLEEIAVGCPNLETLTLPLEELEDQEYWLEVDVVERLVPKLVGIFVAVCPKLNTIKANRRDCRFFGLAQRTFPQLTFFFQGDHVLTCRICYKAENSSNI